MQEVITLAVFVPFAVLYMKQPLKLDYLWAALCMVGAVYFIFRNGLNGAGASYTRRNPHVILNQEPACCLASCCRAKAISSRCSTSTPTASSRRARLHRSWWPTTTTCTCASSTTARSTTPSAPADRITHEVNRLLHKTFITPIDRDQIHQLINTMDDILDLIQDAAETMALYDVRR